MNKINLDLTAIADDDGEHCDSSCPFFAYWNPDRNKCRLFGWLTNDGHRPLKWKRAAACNKSESGQKG